MQLQSVTLSEYAKLQNHKSLMIYVTAANMGGKRLNHLAPECVLRF